MFRKNMTSLFRTVLALSLIASAFAADAPLRAGILPFDVVSVNGATDAAGRSLAKLVRVEMIKTHKLAPELLTPPSGASSPLPPAQAASLGAQSNVDIVLVGIVVDASVSQSSKGLSTSVFGTGVSGRVNRSTATVSLHMDLVSPSAGAVVDSFDVEGKGSETGVGTDMATSLGAFDVGDGSWMKTPMGKALQEAARAVTDEVVKRSGKFRAPTE